MLSRRLLLAAGLAPTQAAMGGPALAATSASPTAAVMGDRGELARSAPPPAVKSLFLAGYASPGDGGGAQYRRADREPAHPGRAASADGAWWELCEPHPTPEMFGADGTPARDTPALQACCDYVRGNFVLTGKGMANQGYVRLSARVYRIDRSIDFGSDGSKYGWGMVGEGQLLSTIELRLGEAFPGIDASGVASFFMRGLRIVRDRSDRSSCGLLLARVQGDVFHNDSPSLDDVGIVHGGPDSVACMVCQAGDLASLNRVEFYNNDAAALCIGGSLPVVLSGACQAGSASSAIGLGPQASAEQGAYVGRSIRLYAGHGGGEDGPVRTIVAYDPRARIATVDRPWPVVPDQSSKFEIFAVRSKFGGLSNRFDATQYRLSNCNFVGTTACLFKGGDELTAINSYFAAFGKGDEAVFLVDAHQMATGMSFRFFNTRWENQTALPGRKDLHAFLTYNQVDLLELWGDINSNRTGSHADGGKIAARRGGVIRHVALHGSCADLDTPLFDIRDAKGAPGWVGCVEGFTGFNVLGTLGSVDVWRLENNYDPAGMTETLQGICRSGSYRGVQFVPREARLSGVAGVVSQVLALQPFDPALTVTQGGAGSQRRARFTVPAKALDNSDPHVRRRLQVDVRGHCPGDVRLGLRVQQGAVVVASTPQSAVLSRGRFCIRLLIMRVGGGWAWSGEICNGSVMDVDFDGALPDLDEAAPISIDLMELSGASNAATLTTYVGLLM